jgi:hypothetical protein
MSYSRRLFQQFTPKLYRLALVTSLLILTTLSLASLNLMTLPADAQHTGTRTRVSMAFDTRDNNPSGASKSAAETYSIVGYVIDELGIPIAQITVETDRGQSAESGSTGMYKITDLPAGTYTLTARAPDFLPVSRTVTVPPDANFQNFIFTPGTSETHTISGMITDNNGDPLSLGVHIQDETGIIGSTSSDGSYTVIVSEEKSYTITPSVNGYTFSPASQTVSVPPNVEGLDFIATPIDSHVAYLPLIKRDGGTVISEEPTDEPADPAQSAVDL